MNVGERTAGRRPSAFFDIREESSNACLPWERGGVAIWATLGFVWSGNSQPIAHPSPQICRGIVSSKTVDPRLTTASDRSPTPIADHSPVGFVSTAAGARAQEEHQPKRRQCRRTPYALSLASSS